MYKQEAFNIISRYAFLVQERYPELTKKEAFELVIESLVRVSVKNEILETIEFIYKEEVKCGTLRRS